MLTYSYRNTHEVISGGVWHMMPRYVAGSHEVVIKCPTGWLNKYGGRCSKPQTWNFQFWMGTPWLILSPWGQGIFLDFGLCPHPEAQWGFAASGKVEMVSCPVGEAFWLQCWSGTHLPPKWCQKYHKNRRASSACCQVYFVFSAC